MPRKNNNKSVYPFASNTMTAATENDETYEPVITTLRSTDVLLGRGNGISGYSGNKTFRRIVWSFRKKYFMAFRNEKRGVATLVVNTIAALDPPGRFVESGENEGEYVIVNETRAFEKTCQALREKKHAEPPPPDDDDDALPATKRRKRTHAKKLKPEKPKTILKAEPPKAQRDMVVPATTTSNKRVSTKKKNKARKAVAVKKSVKHESKVKASKAIPKKVAVTPKTPEPTVVVEPTKKKGRTTYNSSLTKTRVSRSLIKPKVEEATAGVTSSLETTKAPAVDDDKAKNSSSQRTAPSKSLYFNSRHVPFEEDDNTSEHNDDDDELLDAVLHEEDGDFNDEVFKIQIELATRPPPALYSASPKAAPSKQTANSSNNETSKKSGSFLHFEPLPLVPETAFARPQPLYQASPKLFSTQSNDSNNNKGGLVDDDADDGEPLQFDMTHEHPGAVSHLISDEVDTMLSMLPPQMTAFYSGIFSEHHPPANSNNNNNHAAVVHHHHHHHLNHAITNLTTVAANTKITGVTFCDNNNNNKNHNMIGNKERADNPESPATVVAAHLFMNNEPVVGAAPPRLEAAHSLFLADLDEHPYHAGANGDDVDVVKSAVDAAWKEWVASTAAGPLAG